MVPCQPLLFFLCTILAVHLLPPLPPSPVPFYPKAKLSSNLCSQVHDSERWAGKQQGLHTLFIVGTGHGGEHTWLSVDSERFSNMVAEELRV